MDSKDQVRDELYELIAEFFKKVQLLTERANQQTKSNEKQNQQTIQDEVAQKREEKELQSQEISPKNEKISPTDNEKNNGLNISNENESKLSKVGLLSKVPYKELAATNDKLKEFKQELSKDKGKYEKEIIKIEKLQKKIEHTMKKQQINEVNKNINKLKHNSRFYVLRVIETKGKLDTLKVSLENNPRANHSQLDKLSKLEAKLQSKIDRMKTHQINKTITMARLNPRKFNAELNKYRDIERKLESQKNKLENQNDKSHTQNKEKTAAKEKSQSKDKAAELSM